ncbi:hypothetical protein TYRP_009504 [Tyrophagus putrescentiae]|nr:hypothetical protein TYRP_009504 [Tyrophagus putrescentiae]
MKLLLCCSILATLATTFSLAAETTKLHQTGNFTQSPPKSGVNKTSTTTPGQHFYSCSSYQKCSLYLGPNSACNSQGRCVCEVGYEQARKGGSELCQKVTCSSMSDCTEKFGFFSDCNRGSCVCHSDYAYDLNAEKCSRSRPPKTTGRQSCRSVSDCQRQLGLFSGCNQEGRCVCDMGYEEQQRGGFPNGSSSCERRYCSTATSCALKYGANSHCNDQLGICFCNDGHAYDFKTERCTRASIPTTIPAIISSHHHYSCSSFSDCDRHLGVFSSCNAYGRCVCDMGFEEQRATTGSSSSTTGSSKCEQRCSCDAGFSYDYTTGLCSSYTGNTLYHYYYHYSSPNFGLIIGLPVTFISLTIIAGVIIMVRRRRQQELAAAAAARAVAVQRGQHPQNPQQNLPPYTGYQPQPTTSQYQPTPTAPAAGIYPSVSTVNVNFSLAAETAKLHQNDGNSTHHLEKGVQKASSYYCNSFSNCNSFLGVYSSCNSRGRCVCDMGYEERASSTHCQKVVCSSMTDCTGKFGLFSHCSLGSCHCDSGYSYDLELETCSRISTTIPSHYSCSSYSDCDRHLGTWSSCNSNGRSMSDCTTKYGLNSDCSFGRCSCDTGYAYDLQLETCSRSSSYDYYYYHSGPNFGLIIGLPPPAPAPGVYPSVSSGGQYPNPAQTHYKINFSLAAETAKFHTNGNSTHLEKGILKASSYHCNPYTKCSSFLGTYSSCNSEGRCVCDMGYEERASSGHCQRVSCSSVTDCTEKFGLFSYCSLGSCRCQAGSSYDLQLEICTGTVAIISAHYSCSSNSDCDRHLGTWSSCNSNGRCVCDMNFEEKATSSSGLKCEVRSCNSMSDCTTKYGFNSHCSFGSCSCDTGYAYDLQMETCSRISTTTPAIPILGIPIYYSCSSYSDCDRHLGTWSSCNADGRCVCDMGYEKRASSAHCQKVVCGTMSDCIRKFGRFSHCSMGNCHCNASYTYDLQLETCSRGNTIVVSHYSCGSFNDCDQHLGVFSSCNINRNCFCDAGYSYDYTTNLCSSYTGNTRYRYDYYYNSGPNFGLIIGLPVAIIGFIIIIVAIIIIVRRRRQQEMAAAAARVVAMQRGGVVQQQPTTIISHQQNSQHPQHPVYYQQNPQPQQNPPPFNPTFTGYQPQPAPPQYQPPQYQPPAPAPGVYPNVSSSGGQYPNPAQTHYKRQISAWILSLETGPCTDDFQCTALYGASSFCSKQGSAICRCSAGHYFSSAEGRCLLLKVPSEKNGNNSRNKSNPPAHLAHCSGDLDCQKPLGIFSHCSPEEHVCHCDAGHAYDVQVKEFCTSTSSSSSQTFHCPVGGGSRDDNNRQCERYLGLFSSCNKQGKCFTCELIQCTGDSDCNTKMGPSYCMPIKVCSCAKDYDYDLETERCTKFPSVKHYHDDGTISSTVLMFIMPGVAATVVLLLVIGIMIFRRRAKRRRELQERTMMVAMNPMSSPHRNQQNQQQAQIYPAVNVHLYPVPQPQQPILGSNPFSC